MQKKSNFNVLTFMMLIILGLTFLPAISTYATCPDDISSYWKLDEPTPGAPNGTYVDFIKDNDGTGNVNPTAVTGLVNGAQEFNGTTTQIDVPAHRSFDWQQDESFSIEYWIKSAAASGALEIAVGRDDATTDLQWWTGLSENGKASFIIRAKDNSGAGGGLFDVGPVIADGDWHHVVAVRDGENGKNLLYVDGNEEGNADVTFTDGFDSTSSALNIGWINYLTGFHFGGTLDEIALYDRALPQAEIQEHYDAGLAGDDVCSGSAPFVPFPDDTISLWALDEPTPGAPNGTYVDSFDGNDGTGNVNPTAVAGLVNGAQEFNGTTTQIDVPAHRSFDWQQDESFSIEYWIKRAAASGVLEIAVGRDDATTDLQWWTGLSENGKTSFIIRAKDNSGAGGGLSDVGPVIADGDWHHVVAVRDGENGKNILYVDGNEEGNADVTFTDGFDSTSSALNIGWVNYLTGFHFGGTLDEIALYDRALPQTEIQEHYDAGLLGKGIEASRPAPVAVAVANPTNPKETTSVELDGSGSTPGYVGVDAQIASYLWEQTAGTPLVTLSDETAPKPTFTAPDVAAAGMDLTFQLTVTAQDGQSSDPPATVIVSVVDRIPPVADPGLDQDVTEGATVTLDGSNSSDPDGTTLTYLWEEVTTTGVLLTIPPGEPAKATFTAPDVAAAETLIFKLTVTDDDGLTDSDTMNVNVADASVDPAPVADAGPDQTVAPGATVTLDGSASTGTDPTYAWSQTAGTVVQLAGSDTATPTFTAPSAADISAAVLDTLTFKLTVTDNANRTSTATTTVNVDDGTTTSSGGGGGGGGGCFINSMF